MSSDQNAQWHISDNGQVSGPVTWEILLQKANSGELHPSSQLWSDGMPNWVPAWNIIKFTPNNTTMPPIPGSTDFDQRHPAIPHYAVCKPKFVYSGIGFAVIGAILGILAIILVSTPSQYYSWQPPFTLYESITIIIGIIGAVFLLIGVIRIATSHK